MAGSQSLDSMLMCTQPENGQPVNQQEKKPRPADEQALKCPRCDSANTKFCYYNNYSLTQPRYFCKSCRRYWTKGGTLRNVPVGGGCRKNKRSSSLSKRSPPSDYHLQLQPDHLITNHTTSSSYDHHHYHPHPALAPHGNSSIIPLYDGNSQFDLFGGGGGNSFLDTLRGGGGLVECNNNNNNHLLYYGLDTGNVSHDDRHELTMQYDDQNNNSHRDIMSNPSSGSSTPRMKQEIGENRMLWGFPWHLNGEGIQGNYINGGNHEIGSLKENWNTAIVGSSWNNLLNSPLM